MDVSAALTLQKESPNARIIVFEGEEIMTASKGICKIICVPYKDDEYAMLAEEGKKKWETELPYCNFYRQSGWIQEVCGGKYVPFHPGERLITAEGLSYRVHSHDLPQLDAEKELWLNEDIG